MNRAERRFHDQKVTKTGQAYDHMSLKQLFDDAVRNHQSGRYQQAEVLYKQVLNQEPQHSDTLHLLGVLAYQQSQFKHALDFISRAIQSQSQKSLYHFNLGLVHQKLGNVNDSIAAYQRAIELKPNYEEAYTNLGNVLRTNGDLAAAIMAYRQALRAKPDSSAGFNNLGVVLKEQGHRNEAIEAYQQAVRLNQQNAEAHCNLGIALMEKDQYDEALRAFQLAVEHNPEYAKAQHYLGLALLAKEQPDAALSALRASAEVIRNHGRSVKLQTILPSRVKHDTEQLDYLMQHGLSFPALDAYQQVLHSLRAKTVMTPGSNEPLSVTIEESEALAPSFTRIMHYAEAPPMPQSTLNPVLEVKDLERRYFASQPEILCVDDLLRPEAIQALQKFCWESTIWKKDYDNGYIGAMFGEGFSCALLLQIATDLRQTFRSIFKDHQLLQAWAFKQDGQLKPLNIHADAAAINVNFWITPNDANLDPSCGGLIVWDKEAPKEWDFALYNSSKQKPKIMEFLKANEAKPVVVPYRENRALIFNSDLFHESDRCEFRDEYTSRRINITFLYGHRS